MINIPYNINSTIKKAKYFLDNDSKSEKPTLDQITEYVKNLRAIDTHFMFGFNNKLNPSRFEYWHEVMIKCMRLNLTYLSNILVKYRSSYQYASSLNSHISISELNNDIALVFANRFKNTSPEAVRKLIKASNAEDIAVNPFKAFNYFYVLDEIFGNDMSFYSIVEDDKYADRVYNENGVAENEFPLRIYGGRPISRYEAIVNKAISTLYIPEPVYLCLELLWSIDSASTRKFIRTMLKDWFDNDMISSFLKQFATTFGRNYDEKRIPHGNIILIKRILTMNYSSINFINKNLYYRQEYNFESEDLTHVKQYITEFFTKYYSCHLHTVKKPEVLEKPDKPVKVTLEEERQAFLDNENIWKINRPSTTTFEGKANKKHDYLTKNPDIKPNSIQNKILEDFIDNID